MMTIRPATTCDINDIAVIWHQGWQDGHNGLVPDELYQYRTFDIFIPRVSQRIPDTLVSLSGDNKITGFVTVADDELEQIFISKNYRGTGLANELLQAGEDKLYQNGQTDVYLVVIAGNDRAIKFYKKSGWNLKAIVTYQAQIPGGEFPLECMKFTKNLHQL